jgi:hypothetical protein
VGDFKATSLGPCGACGRLIYQMTPTAHVVRGVPPTPYLAHKECADKEASPAEPLPVVVSTVGDISPETVDILPQPPMPSMPTKEQVGRRRKTTATE